MTCVSEPGVPRDVFCAGRQHARGPLCSRALPAVRNAARRPAAQFIHTTRQLQERRSSHPSCVSSRLISAAHAVFLLYVCRV